MASSEILVSAVHLDDVRQTSVDELSHGQQRQLVIAVALAGAPRLLLFDEPAAGLSPTEGTQEEIENDPEVQAWYLGARH